MATCDVCGERLELPHRCTGCDGTFCGRHRLPEAHDCRTLSEWGDGEGHADGQRDVGPADDAGERPAGGVTGQFRRWVAAALTDNVTYVFLGLMVVTFVAQVVVFPLLGYTARSEVWVAAFVLTTAHPEYIWTWLTSVFAHGGVFHLLVNGVVIFFFGRLVEEYVGSKRYAVMFLASGVLAGLAQTAVLAAQGVDGGGLGASGAALAVMGVLTAVNPRMRVYVFFLVPVPVWLFTGGYAALTVHTVRTSGLTAGGVGHLAHLSGLVVGLGYGLYEKGGGRALPDRLQLGDRS